MFRRVIFETPTYLCILGLLVVPEILGAHKTPLGPPQYSAYVPCQLCSPHFAIAVNEDEALDVIGDVARIISDGELLAIKYVGNPIEMFITSPDKAIALGGGKTARRLTGPTHDTAQILTYAQRLLQPSDVRYMLTFGEHGGETLIVGATSFDGSAGDQRLLAGIQHAEASRTGCLSLELALNGYRGDKAWQPAGEKWNPQAVLYPQKPDLGPQYHCIGGLGFSVRAGEGLHRRWKSLDIDGPVVVEIDEARINIGHPDQRLEPVDPGNAKEHPMSPLSENEVAYYPSRGIGPPYAAAGIRDAGSWSVKLAANRYGGMQISFPASEKTGVGFGFLERLEFVETKDVRCGVHGQASP